MSPEPEGQTAGSELAAEAEVIRPESVTTEQED